MVDGVDDAIRITFWIALGRDKGSIDCPGGIKRQSWDCDAFPPTMRFRWKKLVERFAWSGDRDVIRFARNADRLT